MSITLPQRIECLKENRQYNKSWLSRMRIRQVNLIIVISFLTSNVEFLVVFNLLFILFQTVDRKNNGNYNQKKATK